MRTRKVQQTQEELEQESATRTMDKDNAEDMGQGMEDVAEEQEQHQETGTEVEEPEESTLTY